MGEKTREMLEQEIAQTQEELEAKKAELDSLREQMGKQPVDEAAGLENSGEDNEQEAPAVDSELATKEAELVEEVLILQARLVAMQKKLNDLISDEAMDRSGEEE